MSQGYRIEPGVEPPPPPAWAAQVECLVAEAKELNKERDANAKEGHRLACRNNEIESRYDAIRHQITFLIYGDMSTSND